MNNKNITRGRPKNSGVVSRALTPDEVKRLLNVTLHSGASGKNSQRNHVLLCFGFYTGARISEILSLRVADVMENNQISSSVLFQVTKSRRSRRVPLNNRLQSLLYEYILAYHKRNGEVLTNRPLFRSNKGSHIHPTVGSRLVKKLLVEAGLHNAGASHVMRKTALTMLHNSGASLRCIQQISGHSSISQLDAYLSATTSQVDNAVQSLSL